jgi:hypothetical protein
MFKLKMGIIASVLILSINSNHAFLGQDTALLIELVTKTTSQLNELEKLVTNAEKYTKKVQQYNELVQDEYFKAERILYLAQEISAKKEIEDLGDLNFAIRELKYSLSEMKLLMKEYGAIKHEEKKSAESTKIKRRLTKRRKVRAKKQVDSAIKAKTTGRSTQLTAQNTALIHETQLEMQEDQMELLNKAATTNRLLAEQLEQKRLEQIEKQKSYNLKGGNTR